MPEIDRERYDRYIEYHNSGDCKSEAVILRNIGTRWNLSPWQRFQLCYLYSATYCIDSALNIYTNRNYPKQLIRFRTDRRYVRIGSNYEKLLTELDRSKHEAIKKVSTTKQAYEPDTDQKNMLLEKIKNDTKDVCFAIETSLCAWAKFFKGTRWPGYYTERVINEAMQSEYKDLILGSMS